ncbi:unnamed protein product [Allacma fusca]|uniref:F-box domain-containing protein n=1 Tax=Allacma fusca TaxID=39272 RepID=A0A8J2PU27_9HEXA|nr:unnamed protein product [Allacma fusca]
MAEEESLFGKLPPELLNNIIVRMPHTDRLQFRLVCKRWNCLSAFGLKFLVNVCDETIQTSMNCNQRVETFYARDLRSPLPLSYRRKVIQNFNFLRRVFFGPNITASNMKKLLEQVQQADTLGFSYEQPPSFSGLQFNNLTCLQFQKIKSGKSESVAFKKLLSNAIFPVLKRFNLVQIDATDFRVYLAIHLFVVNHATSLRNLILNMSPANIKNATVDPRFQRLYESCDIYCDVSKRTSDVNLETLWINSCNFEGLSPWNLSCKLVTAQRNLECLLLDGIYFSQAIERTQVLQIESILVNNRESLKRLKLPLTDLDATLLSRCLKLEEFGAYVSFEQMKTFEILGMIGTFRNGDSLPTSLRMIDMHIPINITEVQWLLRHIPLVDFVLEGCRTQFWSLEILSELWTICISLTNFRSYVRMVSEEMQRLKTYLLETDGINGNVEFNTNSQFTLVDVLIDRAIYTG